MSICATRVSRRPLLMLLVAACSAPAAQDGGIRAPDAYAPDADSPDASVCPPPEPWPSAVPRLIAPYSGSRTTSRRPTFRWAAPLPSAHLEVCADRACTTVLFASDTGVGHAAPTSDLPPGPAYWRVTSAGVTSVTWPLIVPRRSAPTDASWDVTHDVDGNGGPDLVVSAAGQLGREWGSYLYVNRGDALPDRPDVALGELGSSLFDLDGDGYADVVGPTGAYLGGPTGASPDRTLGPVGGTAVGDIDGDGYVDRIELLPEVGPVWRAAVHLGNAHGSWCATTAVLDVPVVTSAYVVSGARVLRAGDLNADGFADFAINADGIRVFLGSPTGPSATPSVVVRAVTPGGEGFGASAAALGDVNGDGYGDFGVAAPLAAYGYVHLYYGSASGIAATPSVSVPAPHGALPNAYSPSSTIAGVGDVDGDGFGDMAFSTPGARTYVVMGSAMGVSAARIVTLDAPDGVIDAIGDVNGDGFDDIAIGVPRAWPVGAVYLYLGGPMGISTTPVLRLTSPTTAQAFGSTVG